MLKELEGVLRSRELQECIRKVTESARQDIRSGAFSFQENRSPLEVALVETAAPPVYQQTARRALQLRELGMSDRTIAGRLGVTDKTISKAIAWVHSYLAE